MALIDFVGKIGASEGYIYGWKGKVKEKIVAGIQETSANVQEVVSDVVDSGRSALDTVINAVPIVASSALSTATAALAKAQYSGTTGNFQSVLEPIVLTLTYYNAAEDNSSNIGSPCKKLLQLSTLSGFCQCEGAKVALGCTEYEQQAVEDLLNRGVFIE